MCVLGPERWWTMLELCVKPEVWIGADIADSVAQTSSVKNDRKHDLSALAILGLRVKVT